MRWHWLIAAIVLAGCGGKAARPVATASPSPTAAPVATGAWSAPEDRRREPLACPAASSRAGWPSRVLELGDGKFAKLWGRLPRLADVDRDGRLLGQTELGARRWADVRALACGRGARLAAAWVEYRGDSRYELRIATRSPAGEIRAARTVDTARPPYDDGRAQRARAADVGHRPRPRHRRGLLRSGRRGRLARPFRRLAQTRRRRCAGRRRDPLRRHRARRVQQRRVAAGRRPRARETLRRAGDRGGGL